MAKKIEITRDDDHSFIMHHQPSKRSPYSTRSSQIKEQFILDSDSDELYTTPMNNSALITNHQQQQQQGMGDHRRGKHKIRTNRKSIDVNRVDHYRWMIYLLVLCGLGFVLYRLLSNFWAKPKKTLFERLIDDLSLVFTG